jgi:hypothetical protein
MGTLRLRPVGPLALCVPLEDFLFTFQIPQRNIDSRQCRHENWPATVEIMSPKGLPDILDITMTDVSSGYRMQKPLRTG